MQNGMNEIYFDICDNLKMFLLITKKSKYKRTKMHKYIRKLKYFLYNKFNVIEELKEFNEYVLYTQNIEKSAKKIEKILYYFDKKQYKIILSDCLKEKLQHTNSYIINKIIQYNKDDKKIFNKNILITLNYIINIKKSKEQENNIYVISKKYNENTKKNLLYLAKNYKCLNIITENISEYKKFENYMYSNYEIPIIISNNKRKALIRATYIINTCLDEKKLNGYSINREAIIFNLTNFKIKKINCFEGIIINNIKAINKTKITHENYLQQRFINNAKSMEVRDLIGNNGKINLREFNKNNC